MSQVKVTYFNGRGRAEVTRMILTIGKVDFEDKRVNQEEWAKLKESEFYNNLLKLRKHF